MPRIGGRGQVFTRCTAEGHRTCAVRSPFTATGYEGTVAEDLLTEVARSAWALPLLFGLVLADAFLVVVPGEAAVTAFGALAVSHGDPSLVGVVVVASVAALCGDAACYLLGRTIGLRRWRWMRRPQVQAAFAWAHARLERRAALVLFTARFIPFARIAVNLTAT
jgi:membrane protein DedA with SNARE-associated domain